MQTCTRCKISVSGSVKFIIIFVRKFRFDDVRLLMKHFSLSIYIRKNYRNIEINDVSYPLYDTKLHLVVWNYSVCCFNIQFSYKPKW